MEIPDYIKEQLTVLNILGLLLVMAVLFFISKKHTVAYLIGVTIVIVFILCSTPYLPQLLVQRMESSHPSFSVAAYAFAHDTVLIHVLGGGYTLDERFPPNDQLSLNTLGRLVEGIRVFHELPKSILVVSGSSAPGFETQASVVRRAALSVGVDSSRIVMLETPTTTWEEAEVLFKRFGARYPVIVVTDAMHLPRAISFFKRHQFSVTGAPSNHLSKYNPKRGNKWWPDTRNIKLCDLILHEYLGFVKGYFLKNNNE